MKYTHIIIIEVLALLGLPVLAASFMNLETSNFVIFPFALLIIVRIMQLLKNGITWGNDIHKKETKEIFEKLHLIDTAKTEDLINKLCEKEVDYFGLCFQ